MTILALAGLVRGLPWGPIAIGGAILGTVAAFGWQSHKLGQVRLSLASEQLAHETDLDTMRDAALRQAEAFRSIEARLAKDQDEKDIKHATLMAESSAAVARADAAGTRLQRAYAAALAASRGAPAPNPAAVGERPAAGQAPDLLADVFRRLDEATGGIGAYADALRISGERCVADYEDARSALSTVAP